MSLEKRVKKLRYKGRKKALICNTKWDGSTWKFQALSLKISLNLLQYQVLTRRPGSIRSPCNKFNFDISKCSKFLIEIKAIAKRSNIVCPTFEISLYKQCLTVQPRRKTLLEKQNSFSNNFEKRKKHSMLVSSKKCLKSNVLWCGQTFKVCVSTSNIVFHKQISNVWQTMFDRLASA